MAQSGRHLADESLHHEDMNDYKFGFKKHEYTNPANCASQSDTFERKVDGMCASSVCTVLVEVDMKLYHLPNLTTRTVCR